MSTYQVTVCFLAEDKVYGEEQYIVDATVRGHARQQALRKSEDSRFYDSRIDFRRVVYIEDVD